MNNPHLEYINITAEGDKNSINIVHLDITGNPKLKVFELRTKIFKSGLTIENNGLLANLDWAINEYSDGNTVLSKGLIIRNNPNLGREEWLTINATSIAVRRFHFTENTGVDRVMLTTKSIDIMDGLCLFLCATVLYGFLVKETENVARYTPYCSQKTAENRRSGRQKISLDADCSYGRPKSKRTGSSLGRFIRKSTGNAPTARVVNLAGIFLMNSVLSQFLERLNPIFYFSIVGPAALMREL